MIETVLDFHATIGESATWVADEAALYWIDVKAPALNRYSPDDEATRSWPLTSDIGGFALTGDGGRWWPSGRACFASTLIAARCTRWLRRHSVPRCFASTKAPATPTNGSGSA